MEVQIIKFSLHYTTHTLTKGWDDELLIANAYILTTSIYSFLYLFIQFENFENIKQNSTLKHYMYVNKHTETDNG